MKGYKNFDTGFYFTLEELKHDFDQYNCEIENRYASFEDFLDEMLSLGRQKIGGFEEVVLQWVYIEDMTVSRGLFEETIIEADTEEEAFEKAVSLWDGLTDHDKADRSDAWVGLYAIEDGVVDLDSEVSHLEIKNALWYAVMRDRDDSDWGYGSYDRAEAERMCKDAGEESYIAVIQNGNCVEEIEQ